MHSELEAIQRRLADLKRRLDARESVYDIGEELSQGVAVEMNPLTATRDDAPGS